MRFCNKPYEVILLRIDAVKHASIIRNARNLQKSDSYLFHILYAIGCLPAYSNLLIKGN